MSRISSSSAWFSSLVYRVALWRHSLGYYWFTLRRGDLVFVVLFCVAIGLFGFIGYFAYSQHSSAEFERQRLADLGCLARNVFHEARGEPSAGQYAVAEVTLNRVDSRRFPNTVCGVVHEKRWDRKRRRYVGAFSWTELDVASSPKGIAWERAVAAAVGVYDNEREPLVQRALFYHAVDIHPGWADSKQQITTIGRHVFYE